MELEMKDIMLAPLAGWTTATLPEGNLMLELQLLAGSTPPADPAELERRKQPLRVSMTAAAADELAGVLQRAAAEARRRAKREAN